MIVSTPRLANRFARSSGAIAPWDAITQREICLGDFRLALAGGRSVTGEMQNVLREKEEKGEEDEEETKRDRRVRRIGAREDDGKRRRGAKRNEGGVRRGAFFFGPWWSSHRVITRDEGAYMSNLYSARSSVSKFEST